MTDLLSLLAILLHRQPDQTVFAINRLSQTTPTHDLYANLLSLM